MAYIKEPKGVDFVVEPHVVTADDRRIISEAIAHYKATGKFKRVLLSQHLHYVKSI